MKARYVVIGGIVLVFSVAVFVGIQEVKGFSAEGDGGTGMLAIGERTPEQAARLGMSQEIAGWSQLVEIAAFVGGMTSVAILGYGLVSRDSVDDVIPARR